MKIKRKTCALILILVLSIISMCIPAFAASISEGNTTDYAAKLPGETILVIKTWENGAGEKVTGVISKPNN